MINMNLNFKTPQDKTQVIKSKVSLGEDVFYGEAYKIAEDKIKKFTNHSYCNLTNSGNSSIFLALIASTRNIIIPDQGAWNGFRQFSKLLNKEIEILKTDIGIINTDYLDDLNINNDSTLIFTSFAAYSGEQDIKSISKYCKDNNILLIEDASGGICDNKKRLANGKYSDIIVGSTGSPKMINVGNGGFITFSNNDFLDKIKIPYKIAKCDYITSCGISCEVDFTENIFKKTVTACKYLKSNLDDVIHLDKRGLNVIIRCENPKTTLTSLKKNINLDKGNLFTLCPNYNRVKEKAIAIEIKNLNPSNLKKEILDELIEIVKIYQ